MTLVYKRILAFLLGFQRYPSRVRLLPRRLRLDVRAMQILQKLKGVCIQNHQSVCLHSAGSLSHKRVLENVLTIIRIRLQQPPTNHPVISTYRPKWKRARFRLLVLVRWFSPRHRQLDRSQCRACCTRSSVGLVECRCGYVFCIQHRLPHTHTCRIDPRWVQSEKIRRENPKITTDRIHDRC